MLWDVFCRVVDNYGDVGVGWRLAAELAARGETVRFWLDDRRALAWMAPRGAVGVSVGGWADAVCVEAPGDVVLEAFDCGLPPAFAERMATRRPRPPVWIDLEYLSAEAFVERSHGLPSPRSRGPGAGLVRWFFFPGFTAATGGLLREAEVTRGARRAAGGADPIARAAFLRELQPLVGDALEESGAGRRLVGLFCYANPALPALLDALAAAPTLLLLLPGPATDGVSALLGPDLERGALRAVTLPFLDQPGFDRLLCACDLAFVRGEDSFVRAQWAGVPLVWQLYPQTDGAHHAKLEAFLDRFLAGAPGSLGVALRRLFRQWNGGASPEALSVPLLGPWQAQCERWREGLLAQDDLCTRLLGFAGERR